MRIFNLDVHPCGDDGRMYELMARMQELMARMQELMARMQELMARILWGTTTCALL